MILKVMRYLEPQLEYSLIDGVSDISVSTLKFTSPAKWNEEFPPEYNYSNYIWMTDHYNEICVNRNCKDLLKDETQLGYKQIEFKQNGEQKILITDTQTYILNDDGKTIETVVMYK